MSLYFTSDLHFGHTNIIEHCHRPFASVDEMNWALVRNWNAVVGPADIVMVLGDFSLKTTEMEHWAPKLNGTKYLVPGNHDACHPMHGAKGRRAAERYIAAGFRSAQPPFFPAEHNQMLRFEIAGKVDFQTVFLCHMPLTPVDDRYPEWTPNQVWEDAWLLHGHVHDKWKTNGRQINVGVDVWNFAPVAASRLIELMTATPQEAKLWKPA